MSDSIGEIIFPHLLSNRITLFTARDFIGNVKIEKHCHSRFKNVRIFTVLEVEDMTIDLCICEIGAVMCIYIDVLHSFKSRAMILIHLDFCKCRCH